VKFWWGKNSDSLTWRRYLGWQSVVLMAVGGIVVLGARSSLEQTNTLEFCISCHEMKDNNFEEYSHTIHARNRTGVKAICSDCHVPHEFVDTMLRKLGAANDVIQHFAGAIDTREKFEARRTEMATKVWQRMKATDSRECRHCHDTTAMAPEMQGRTAQKQHLKVQAGERTCIDCHFGIAHKEPAGGVEPKDVVARNAGN